ncbi:MAG: HAMP domain-containing histidine kinase, partial [Candidatus Eisenbacteria bacterium]|nr:HAMP domain-containing histidine kinase [Candidatus Eisenbacteria bacterium]
TLAMSNPLNIQAVEDVEVLTGCIIQTFVSTSSEIKKAIEVLEETPGDEIYLIPVRLMECKPKYRKLNELHWIDLFPRWEDGVNQIIRSIDGEQGHADLSKTPTPLDDIVIERDENAKPKRLKTLVHLSEMVRETIEIFGKYARRRNVIIDFTDTAPNAHVIASRPEIITAIANVLNNAIKYSYSGRNLESKVMLSTSQARSKAIIQIENWGVGIPKQDIESGVIFERGFRTPDAKEHTAGGMGMGLWLAREISRKYKGDIVVESKPVRWMIGEGDPRPPYVTTVRLIYPAEKIE